MFLICFLEKRQFTWRKVLAHGFDSKGLGPWGRGWAAKWSSTASPPQRACGSSVGKVFCSLVEEVFFSLFYPSLRLHPFSQYKHSSVFWIVCGCVFVRFVLSSPKDPSPCASISIRVPGLAWMRPGPWSLHFIPGHRLLFLPLLCGLVNGICFYALCCILCAWEIGITPLEYTGTCSCAHCVYTY